MFKLSLCFSFNSSDLGLYTNLSIAFFCAKGEPTKKAMALKKWGFGSVAAASSFCSKNKSKK